MYYVKIINDEDNLIVIQSLRKFDLEEHTESEVSVCQERMQTDDYCYYIHAVAGVFCHKVENEGIQKFKVRPPDYVNPENNDIDANYIAMVYSVRN